MQICGGVSSGLRSRLIDVCPPKVHVPDLSICDGNGAMVTISVHMCGQGADSFPKFARTQAATAGRVIPNRVSRSRVFVAPDTDFMGLRPHLRCVVPGLHSQEHVHAGPEFFFDS